MAKIPESAWVPIHLSTQLHQSSHDPNDSASFYSLEELDGINVISQKSAGGTLLQLEVCMYMHSFRLAHIASQISKKETKAIVINGSFQCLAR